MFYCEACRKKQDWPEGFLRSHGACEICSTPALCYDVPSRALPIPKGKPRARGKAATLRYVVVVKRGTSTTAIGPYRTFKRAEGDAKAWDGTEGRTTHVLPLRSLQEANNV